jgi:Eukaryotic aspartyl protease
VQQDFWVEIDTSTSDLFIPHDSCKDTACTEKFRYKSDASSTSKELGKPFSIEKYHTVASGDLYSDTVTVGHTFTITNQTFGAVRPSASFS